MAIPLSTPLSDGLPVIVLLQNFFCCCAVRLFIVFETLEGIIV